MLEALLRLALRMSPAAFRRRFGDEMIATARALADVLLLPVATRHAAPGSRANAWLRGATCDARHALRLTRSAPWYALAVSGVIALAMTLGGTAFAIVDGVLFMPVDLPGARALVMIEPGHRGTVPRGRAPSVSVADLEFWSARVPGLTITGFSAQPWGGFGTGVNDQAAGGARVLPNFFDVVGVQPLVGGFESGDFTARAAMQPVIVSWDIWQRRFGGAPDVVGREVKIDRAGTYGYRVVGVMPKGFRVPSARTDVDFIAPLVVEPEARTDLRRRSVFEVLARLPDGVPVGEAEARLPAGLSAAADAFPPLGARPEGWSDGAWRRQGPFDTARVVPLATALGDEARPLFLAAFLAAVVIVTIGALNVSSLLAARTIDRRGELSVRRAIGAGSFAVARLVVVEAGLLVGVGGLAALAMTPAALNATRAILPDTVTFVKPPVYDARTAAFILIATATLILVASVWPLWRALRAPAVIGTGSARASERTRTFGRRMVVGMQVAGAFVLLVAGSLLVGSILSVYAHEQPIHTDGVLVVETFVEGPGASMDVSDVRTARVGQLLDRLATVPGIERVGVTSAQVLRGGNWVSWFAPPPDAPRARLEVDRQAVTAGYFDVLAPTLVAGRLPTDGELESGAPLLVVSESLARAYWADGQAVGRTLVEQGRTDPFTVIGIVRDVRWFAWDREVPSIYGPYRRLAREPMVTIVARASGREGQVLADLLSALERADPLLAPQRAASLEEMFVESVNPRRFRAWIFGAFAAASLVVCGVGVLGLLAMTVARRTRELGIRQALGATRHGLVHLLLREELAPVIAGLAAGALAAAWAVPSLDAYLYGVTYWDVRIWLVSAALLFVTAAAGAIVPALRASRTDPVRALAAG